MAMIGCDGKLDELVEDGNYTISKDANYATWYNYEDSFDVDASSAKYELQVSAASSTQWNVSSGASWIHFSPSSGNGSETVTCTFDDNPRAYLKRRGIITLSYDGQSGGESKSTVVVQRAAAPEFDIDDESIRFPVAGGTITRRIITNCNNVQVSSSSYFINATLNSNLLTITAEPNTSNMVRSGNVQLSYDYLGYSSMHTGTKSINISQAKPTLTGFSDRTVSSYGETFTMTIKSDYDWTARCNYSWISITPTKGAAGETVLTVTVDKNSSSYSRTGYIYFYQGNSREETMMITQGRGTLY